MRAGSFWFDGRGRMKKSWALCHSNYYFVLLDTLCILVSIVRSHVHELESIEIYRLYSDRTTESDVK